jgi:hypothetical protein
MGGGILPTTIYKNKLYFLFGKENKYADTPGFSDFGGGTEKNESYLQTAIREGGEELTGFLGSDEELSKMLKKRGTYNINNDGDYRMHIFFMKYDEALPHYYNNNQRFIQKRLDPAIIKKTKIFEKAEIRWFCIDELLPRKKEFRSYFQKIVEKIVAQQAKIFKFIQKCQKPDIYSSEIDDTSSSSSTSTSGSSNWDETTTKSTTTWDDTTSGEDATTTSTESTSTSTSISTSSPKTQKIYKNKRKNKKTKGRRKIKIM